ncbi:hypothetical protein MNBD_IGNAVI01-2441 [hydrothermal vent metagenome]|uniref:Uncharacterized protein n=1 Tax=hydrothermal vent metagenome TaxID=652676 RepID=A0A3B1CQU5_9ZZZZ
MLRLKKASIWSRYFVPAVVSLTIMVSSQLFSQGKYLRGEVWQKFSVENSTADFYISPDGNDDWSGTLDTPNSSLTDGPFKTFTRAQEAVRELKKEVYKPEGIPIEKNYIGSPHELGSGKDILVQVREGYYELDEPLLFSPEDGGERVETDQPSGAFEYHKLKDYYVTYSAYPGEHPVVSGGKRIRNWKQEGKVWHTNTKGLDVKKLVVNGRMQTLARTPNSGYFVMPKAAKSTTEFYFKKGDIKAWQDMEQNKIIMYLRWHVGINKIKKVDEAKGIGVLEKPQEGIVVISPRYYVENVKALLDTAGEWYFNRKTNDLFYIPSDDISDLNSAKIVSPVISDLIVINGEPGHPVRNIRFYGLTLEALNGEGNAFAVRYADYCELVDSEIRAVAGKGIFLGLGSFETRIMNNKIVQADRGAVEISGDPYPDKFADIIRQNTVSYNYMNDCGGNVIGVRNTLYTTISHNEISHNRGRYPIYVGGWANLEEALEGGYRVEYNHLHHVQALSDDSGVITSGGYTHDSVIRKNLIHDVSRGMFNDNVAIWFDNMSSGWTAEDNIYYNLQQGEMKLCAANLIDNLYTKNFKIDPPAIPPEGIITGDPEFQMDQPVITIGDQEIDQAETGNYLTISSLVKNIASTGVQNVVLWVNGKTVASKRSAIVKDNSEIVKFNFRFAEPGDYVISVGASDAKFIKITGDPLSYFSDKVAVSSSVIPLGESLKVSADILSLDEGNELVISLYDNNKEIQQKKIEVGGEKKGSVSFDIKLGIGEHNIRIGNSKTVPVKVYPHKKVDISKIEFAEYCSARAEPHEITIDQKNNKFIIKAAGTDFYHGEDSYATAYIKKPIKGNFVATIKVVKFGKKTNEWFRTGLFVRNDITKSFDTGEGSLGSVLMFVSPGRAGMNWDEFGDGCMHKANSQNHPTYEPTPMWIKLVRHGNSFSGYVSYDGKNWTVSRHTGDIPGINEAVNLGIAAGGPDERVYSVEFEDFTLDVEK